MRHFGHKFFTSKYFFFVGKGVRGESVLKHFRGENGCLKFVKEKRFKCPEQGCRYVGKKPEHLKLHISNGHHKNWAAYFIPDDSP